jgi:hypothetical protein
MTIQSFKDTLDQGCGSGSVLGIRIQGQENLKISVEKMHFSVIFNKNFTTKKVKLLFEKKI